MKRNKKDRKTYSCKKRNYENKKNRPQKSIGLWEKIKMISVGFLFVVGLFIMVSNFWGDKKIKEQSKCTIGWIYDKGVFRETDGLRHYYFMIGGKKYYGMCYFGEKGIGDTIRVYYYPDDPDINRGWIDYYEDI